LKPTCAISKTYQCQENSQKRINLHKIITSTAFRTKRHPQEMYRQLCADLLGYQKFDEISRLRGVQKQKLFPEFLAATLEQLRKSNSKVNILNKQGALTGSCRKIQTDLGRSYLLNNDEYPSVSSILRSNNGDIQKYIDKGKTNLTAEIGEIKANNYYNLPVKVGDYTHSCIELYLLGIEGGEKIMQRSIAKHLIDPVFSQVKRVKAVEYPVYHRSYRYAGTIDSVLETSDGIYLYDWKTSIKPKTNSSIKNYKLQVAAYCLAYYSMTGEVLDGAKICVMYRSKIGKRNPRYFDIFTINREELKDLSYQWVELVNEFNWSHAPTHLAF
jgi:hypothetical protein